MALANLQFPRNSCCALKKPKNQWIATSSCCTKVPGFTLEMPSFKNLNDRSLVLSNTTLHTTNYGSKRKGISVATPKRSQIIRTNELLDAYEDEYDGVVIVPECLPDSIADFIVVLRSSLSYWKSKGKKGIWLKLLEEQADLVPVVLKEGFQYHHAESGYVMLTYWIPDEPCMLPSTATHQIGIGAFVINENREVLVVKEKKCPLRCSGLWKLPTGFIDKSEEIFCGAMREVKEETGINSMFLEVVAFRHAHHVIFEKSDLFFICMLKPLSFEITIDESEIQAAKWMPLDEFKDQPFLREDRMLKNSVDICIARYEDRYCGFAAYRMMSKFDGKLSYLYYGAPVDSTGSTILQYVTSLCRLAEKLHLEVLDNLELEGIDDIKI